MEVPSAAAADPPASDSASPVADSGVAGPGVAGSPVADSGVADSGVAGRDFAEQVEALQAATRVLAGVALRSLDVLDGVTTLPQFRMLAVLAVLGRARSARVARALGLDASTVTRLADRLVAAGHVERGSNPRHRSVVTLELTSSGQSLASAVSGWRQRELSRIVAALPPATRAQLTSVLGQLVTAAGKVTAWPPNPSSPSEPSPPG
jgi:DNA-binding MarR family transcriptional regulator